MMAAFIMTPISQLMSIPDPKTIQLLPEKNAILLNCIFFCSRDIAIRNTTMVIFIVASSSWIYITSIEWLKCNEVRANV